LRDLLGRDRQVLSRAHPRAGLAAETRRGELLQEPSEPAGVALDQRGREVQERVALPTARGLSGESAEKLSEETHW
jgi:hypothetical protein